MITGVGMRRVFLLASMIAWFLAAPIVLCSGLSVVTKIALLASGAAAVALRSLLMTTDSR